MKPWAEQFYGGYTWKQVRREYLIEHHYMCERCGGVATMVHHKKYLTESNINNMDMALGLDNLEALCDTCHQHEHHLTGATADGVYFNANGELIEVPKAPPEK